MPIRGIGSVLQASDMQPNPSWTNIAAVGEIQIDRKVTEVDVTSQDSPDFTMERIPVLIDPGTLKFPLFYDPLEPTSQLMDADLSNFFVRDYRLIFTQQSPQKKRIYHAFVSDLSEAFPVNNVMKRTVALTNRRGPNLNA